MIGWNAFFLLATITTAPAAVAATVAPPPPEQVMAVPAELRQRLHEQVLRDNRTPEQRLQRLVDLVFQPQRLDPSLAAADLQYDTAATFTVAETWAQRRANCLSFTLLFIALAREAGLDAQVQEVGQVIGWYQEQGMIYNAGHVNVGLRMGGRRATLDLDQNVLYDRRGPQPITDQRALAHFYNNRGAELMAARDSEGARAYLQMALRMDSHFAPAWNNLGVLETRDGNDHAAAQAFTAALRAAPTLASALSNANALYLRSGQTQRAAQLDERLRRVREHDPFHHFMQGMDAERRNDYAQAVTAYRRAIQLYGNVHQFHFGLARAYFLEGDNRRAMRELARAHELGGNDHVRAVYQPKLDSLRRINGRHASR